MSNNLVKYYGNKQGKLNLLNEVFLPQAKESSLSS